jgi:hypothetical protein
VLRVSVITITTPECKLSNTLAYVWKNVFIEFARGPIL